MLLEAANYALSWPSTPPAFRPHLSDAIGLWARGRRQRRAWAPHLRATASAIEAAMPHGTTGTAAILGSGPLFDVPLPALTARFTRVLLVDRAHLAGARSAAGRHPAAEIVWRDLSPATGGPQPLAFLREVRDLQWVVSVNLLSQLAHRAPEGREREVVDAHLDDLAALPCPVTLVTDLSYGILDRAGRPLERADLLYGRAMPSPARRWDWEVAPSGEENRTTRRVHTVAFYPDWRRAAG